MRLIAARVSGMPVCAFSARSAICAALSSPKRCSKNLDAGGEERPRLGDLGAAVDRGEDVAPPRDRAVHHERELPAGSAATTSERVSQVRSGSSLRRPVNHAPTRGPSLSSHQHAVQMGLHSPMRVTSATHRVERCG